MLDLIKQLQDRTELREIAPAKQEYKRIGAVKLLPNQKLYSCNLDTGTVKEVPLLWAAELQRNGVKGHGRATHEMNCIYYGAYNYAQAYKHFRKLILKYIENLKKQDNGT